MVIVNYNLLQNIFTKKAMFNEVNYVISQQRNTV